MIIWFCFLIYRAAYTQETANISIIFSDKTSYALRQDVFRDIDIYLDSVAAEHQNNIILIPSLYTIMDKTEILNLFMPEQIPVAIIDLSYSLTLSQYLGILAEKYKVPIFQMMQEFESTNDWVFNAHMSYTAHSQAMVILMIYFRWATAAMVTSPTDYAIRTSKLFEQNFNVPIKLYCVNDVNNSSIRRQVARQIKPMGTRITAIFAEPQCARQILIDAEDSYIAGEGYGFVLSANSALQSSEEDEENEIIRTGSLVIYESGTEDSIQVQDQQISVLRRVLNDIAASILSIDEDSISGSTINGLNLQKSLQSLYSDGNYRNPSFSVINYQNSKRVIVGKILESKYSPNNNVNILFPGGTLKIPSYGKSSIPFSTNRDMHNADGFFSSAGGIIMKGHDLAIEHINNSSLTLPNHDFYSFDYGAGASVFRRDYALEKIGDLTRKDLGYATVMPPSSSVSMGMMRIFDEFGYDIQSVCASCTSIDLSDSTEWPNFIRMNASDDFQPFIIADFMIRSNWKECAILYTNSPWANGLYTSFTEVLNSKGIIITNPYSLRKIPIETTYETSYTIEEQIKSVIDGDSRVLILLMLDPILDIVIQSLYDMGVKSGRFVLIIADGLESLAIQDDEGIQELVPTSIQVLPKPWIGEFGLTILKELTQRGQAPLTWTCHTYDATFGIGLTFDRMLSAGQEFENSQKFRKSFRENRFTGWSGLIIQEQQKSNNRLPAEYRIQQAQVKAESKLEKILLRTIVTYDPTGYTLFTNEMEFIWADGTSNTPSGRISESYTWPFPDGEQEIFAKGRMLTFGAWLAIGIMTAVIIFFIWKMWWRVSLAPLCEKNEISVADVIVMGIEFTDAVQFASVGPDFRSFSTFLALISDALSANLEELIELKEGYYWIALNIVFSCCATWLIWSIIVIKKLDLRFERVFFCKQIGQISLFLVPLLDEIGFLPITSILLDVLVCDEGYSKSGEIDWTDSFLWRDCHVTCWKREHIIYVSFSVLWLFVFVPSAVYTRPLWQHFETNLHVFQLPLYTMVKTVVQIVFIIFTKTLIRVNEILHGFIFIAIMWLYIYFNFKIKAFNYDRAWLWHILSLYAVLWLAILWMLDKHTDENLTYVILMFTGWGCLITFGLIYQNRYYPSLLYRRKPKNSSMIFEFGFRRESASKVAQMEKDSVPDWSILHTRKKSGQEADQTSQIDPETIEESSFTFRQENKIDDQIEISQVTEIIDDEHEDSTPIRDRFKAITIERHKREATRDDLPE